ncbi:hypothetical protein EDC94DRAFT_612945 [Helicostylum pulchrum]|nr:hypothetical protein EDC94DRAFT_612945 [Helicostylum pulchrum]
MRISKEPFSSDHVMLDYFSNTSPHDSAFFDDSSSQTITNNSDEIHHPLSEKPIVTSPPIISKNITPLSISRNEPTDQHITHETSNRKQRPDSNTSGESEYFDAVSYIEDHRPITPTISRTISNTSTRGTRRTSETVYRRPSGLTGASSTYTNETTNIHIDQVDIKKGYYLYESVVLCAVVSKYQIKVERQPFYSREKKLLRWKEYKAVIAPTGYLELYKICDCRNSFLPVCFHFHHKKPQYSIPLNPTYNNILFERAALAKKSKIQNEPAYFLSLSSDIDFSWCLASRKSIFYFQSQSVHVSQQWYRSLYACLPSMSKRPFPKLIELDIPELSATIKFPVPNFTREDENVQLSKLLDSALMLLKIKGVRPSNWNKNTVGLCWRSYVDSTIDWAIKPKDTRTGYLIEPRLVEKTHELQLRFYTDDTPPILETPAQMEGYILDASNSRTLKKSNRLLYAVTMDHYLFLYENKLHTKKIATNKSIFCFYRFKRTNPIIPNLPPLESSTPRSAVGVIDLLKIEGIAEESFEAYDEEEKAEHVLHLYDRYLFQILNMPSNIWTERLRAIQEYYKPSQVLDQILQSSVLYVKNAKSTYATFKKRLCILTSNGDICAFKASIKNSYDPPEFTLSLKDQVYIYSGEDCGGYISGLPTSKSKRMFENGEIMESDGDNKPSRCCIIIRNKGKQYVLLARSHAQKNVWVNSICSFL